MKRMTDSRLANIAATTIHTGFTAFEDLFDEITRRAPRRFENSDLAAMREDAAERMDVYQATVIEVEASVRELLGEQIDDRFLWVSMKAVYSRLISECEAWDIAETFFNSITRRIFNTVGVDGRIEFVDTDFDSPPNPSKHPVFRVHGPGTPREVTQSLLSAIQNEAFERPWSDLAGNVTLTADRIAHRLAQARFPATAVRLEIAERLMYRGRGAYAVGRVVTDGGWFPLCIALRGGDAGIRVDAVLTSEPHLAQLFSFTRAYFHVDVRRPYELVRFLAELMPNKHLGQIYISLGYNRHGKTELFRDLLGFIQGSDERFEHSRGKAGMVMLVFNMPTSGLVIKVIRDRFPPPKTTTREQVRDRYRLVHKLDRFGRLVEAHSFEYLEFDRDRFAPELLAELENSAKLSVRIDEDRVILNHAYVERRVIPLDLYVRERDHSEAAEAVIDFGATIKDLAANNIFPGDMLLKNFGVTRHGRVVFYDYDELGLLTDYRFRKIPEARSEQETFSARPWYTVAEGDVFPEEFKTFLGLPRRLREVFEALHSDLYGVEFWQRCQQRLNTGTLIDFRPYPDYLRLTRPVVGETDPSSMPRQMAPPEAEQG